LEKRAHTRRATKGARTRTPAVIRMARKSVLFFLKNTVENTENDKGIKPTVPLGEDKERKEEGAARVPSILF
jgi:hypothetical protein